MKKTKGVIAAGSPHTAEAGKRMYEEGGNAFDSICAASFCSFVAESPFTGAGGGGFLLAQPQNKKPILFDFFTQTPFSKKLNTAPNFYPVTVDFGSATQDFHIGLASMSVPGNLKGLFHVQEQLGLLPMHVVLEPAIELARTGFKPSAYLLKLINLIHPILTADAVGKKLYEPELDHLQFEEMADVFSFFAQAGIREFYEGEIAQKIGEICKDRGGYLRRDDFKKYEVIERSPLAFSYRNFKILSNPPPSAGGSLIAFALKLIESVSFKNIKPGSAEHLKILTESLILTADARRTNLDPNIRSLGNSLFLDPEFIADCQVLLKKKCSFLGSTTHISCLDELGNAASLTTSLGQGSGFHIPGTQIMMNNMLGEADLHPEGFHLWPENERIQSMMAPSLILDGTEVFAGLGTGGANRIRTAIFEVIHYLIDFELSLEQAVSMDRIHYDQGKLFTEPDFSKHALRDLELDLEHHPFDVQSLFFGGVHSVGKSPKGHLQASADSRRNGTVARV